MNNLNSVLFCIVEYYFTNWFQCEMRWEIISLSDGWSLMLTFDITLLNIMSILYEFCLPVCVYCMSVSPAVAWCLISVSPSLAGSQTTDFPVTSNALECICGRQQSTVGFFLHKQSIRIERTTSADVRLDRCISRYWLLQPVSISNFDKLLLMLQINKNKILRRGLTISVIVFLDIDSNHWELH